MVFETESHSQDGGFAFVHRVQHTHHVAKAVAFDERFVGAHLSLVHDHVTKS